MNSEAALKAQVEDLQRQMNERTQVFEQSMKEMAQQLNSGDGHIGALPASQIQLLQSNEELRQIVQQQTERFSQMEQQFNAMQQAAATKASEDG